MSELRVDNIVDMGGSGAPQLRKGASVTGISTITQAVVGNATINAGGINATGVVTSTSNKFIGDFSSGNITAGVMTATSSVVASNITINSGGVNASGIVSATSYQGSGANLTGIGLTIAPLMYNPPVSGVDASLSTGIGLTFNQRVSAGTGNVTLSLVAVGSTVVENFGVGSSVTYNNDADPPNITITPTNALSKNTVYAISYPSGAFTQSGAGGSSVGIAYTFDSVDINNQIWLIGSNNRGQLGQNSDGDSRSSPVQMGGKSNWKYVAKSGMGRRFYHAINTDGELWGWGYNRDDEILGLGPSYNSIGGVSSPVQIPGTTWDNVWSSSYVSSANKTDGTLWIWGDNWQGTLGMNQAEPAGYNSPVQLTSATNWTDIGGRGKVCAQVNTDGELYIWGYNNQGGLGQNNQTNYSSPVQVPGTTWANLAVLQEQIGAVKTNGTLWMWGQNQRGVLGQNQNPGTCAAYSSPVQIPGTTWSTDKNKLSVGRAIKTDGTLWTWGNGDYGALGQNSTASKSSPVQVPGTNWASVSQVSDGMITVATKTDGTAWSWGYNDLGALGQNNRTQYSSPVQIPGTSWSKGGGRYDGIWLMTS